MSAVVVLQVLAEAQSQAAPGPLGAALEEIYRANFPLVWRGLRRLGVPERSLEDAAQDVFLIVYRRWAEFEGRSSLRTWIYGIVLRVAKDHRRAEQRHAHRVQGLAQLLSVAPAAASTPADEVERREANQLLHTVLGSLTDEHREVLVLVELEQLPVREAATALGIHVRACQRRLRAAHSAFEAELSPYLSPAPRTP